MRNAVSKLVVGAVVAGVLGSVILVVSLPRLARAQPPPVTTRSSQDFPDFNTDAVPMIGAVAITNTPTVVAVQGEDWGVQLVGEATVHLATPGFLEVGRAYAVTWPGSAPAGPYRVRGIAAGGWILAEDLADPGRGLTWVNAATAATIQETRP